MDNEALKRKQTKILLDRLERLSVDSVWAHRASGLRGSLIRALELSHLQSNDEGHFSLEMLIEQGFRIITEAAREIPDYENKIA